jgi:hypothetical protein
MGKKFPDGSARDIMRRSTDSQKGILSSLYLTYMSIADAGIKVHLIAAEVLI